MQSTAERLPEQPRRHAKRVLVADLFCGAGGSSTGAARALDALGMRLDLACVNHWPTAIDTHQRNHPAARHYCQDVATVRPSAVVPEGRLDLLLASPTCTYHSRARGGRPTSDQQRMDPWHIITWLTELRVRRMIIENVPEMVQWGPVDARTGKPTKSRKGEYFRQWVETIRALGFAVEWRILNAADYGDATTRHRFFLIARSDGKPLRWPEPTHTKHPTPRLFGPPLQRWRPACEIIDWSIQGKSIFGRRKPLKPKTLARIYSGAAKFRWPEPYLVVLRRHMAAQGIDAPLPTITAGGNHIGLVQPFMLGQQSCAAPRSTNEPVPTIATEGAISSIAPYYGSSETCGSVGEPLPTITTRDRFGLVVPVTGANRGELAFITAAFGEREGQAPRVHSVDDPAPTICATGRINLVEGRDYDILFRMLQPHELAAAMGFDAGSVPYEFTGNKGEVVKQIGNSVPVHTATALVAAMMGGE